MSWIRLELAAWLWMSMLAPATLAQEQPPVRPGEELEEQVRVRVLTVRLRVQPTRLAEPGECAALAVEDLKVSLRGERVRDPRAMRLDRERRPALHALLIDTSGSMAGKLDYVRSAASEYVRRLRPEDAKALVATFDESVILSQGVTADRGRLIAAIDGLRMGNSTSILDGLDYLIREMSAHRERPVLLLLTDGVDTASLHEIDDVRRLVQDRPDLTIFVIGLALPPISRFGSSGLISSRRFLYRLAARSNGAFFNVPTGSRLNRVYRRIRDMLENEATLSIDDPDPDAKPGRVKVSSRTLGCRVTVFREGKEPGPDPRREPIVRPLPELPQTLPLPPHPIYREIYVRSPNPEVDPACRQEKGDVDPGMDESSEQFWFMNVEPGRIRGCGLDLTMDYDLLYDPYAPGWVEPNTWIGLKTRPFEIPVPALRDLPARPEQVLDRLAGFALTAADAELEIDHRKRPEADHARPYHDYLGLNHGRIFFDMRPSLARALLLQPDYGEWVSGKLHEEAQLDLQSLVERLRRDAPDRSDEELRAAVNQSKEGRRILARTATPSELDLQRHLTAWLGDISVHELFARWEALWIDRSVEGTRSSLPDGSFPDAWRELRRVFFVPSYARVLTLLHPVHDSETDRIGFYRMVLPRPSWLRRRVKGWKKRPDYSDLPVDLVPDIPFGFWAIGQIVHEKPDLAAHLRERGYRTVSVTYELLGKPRKRDPGRAFRETRVTVVLESPRPGESERPPRLRLTADVGLPEKKSPRRPHLDRVDLVVTGDPRLEELARTGEVP